MTYFKWGDAPYLIVSPDGQSSQITVKGRNRWALEALMKAGRRGCTPIDNPAPRWSAYTYNLRQMGVAIETVHEQHGGAFSGNHGRYILRCQVLRVGMAVCP